MRASFSTTHQPAHSTRRQHTSAHPPLSLIGVPWRFLHLTADNGATLPPVLSDAGRQYMEEDAYRWQTQQTAADVISPVPQLTHSAHTRPLRLAAYGEDGRGGADVEGEEDEEDAKQIPPLAEFNPFSDTFAVALSPVAQHTATLNTARPAEVAVVAGSGAVVEEGTEVSKKKRGMVAADLLSHFAQKEVVDEERERTRQRERSKWDNTSHSNGSQSHSGGVRSQLSGVDGGGVMVGGLGLSDESNSARQARLAVDAEEEERRRRLSAAADDGDGLTAADMPDMSDFIKLYEDEDEPSYPAIIWRQKERLTEAADVPSTVVAELHAIDRERMSAVSKRRGRSRESGGTRVASVRRAGHQRKPTLRFNLGLGRDYEEEGNDDDSNVSTTAAVNKPHTGKNRFPYITGAGSRSTVHMKAAAASKVAQSMYGRQWYLPVVQWSTAEEEKERLEAATFDRAQQPHISSSSIDSTAEEAAGGDTEAADGYHGDGWRDKVLALKAELPQLYCSRAFKAFLLREREKEREGGSRGSSGSGSRSGSGSGGRRRLPHYLEGVEALDEKREEEDEKRAIQAAVLAITTPRITHSSAASTASTRTQSAASASGASGPLLPVSPMADDSSTSGVSGLVGEEEREGDLLEYMREVRMRELNLAGLRWIKEREKAMEERERRKKEKEKRKARVGSTAVVTGGAGGGGSDEVVEVEEDDAVDLDELFNVPDYPCSLT